MNPLFDDERSHDETQHEFGWAVEIVRRHFAAGLTEICDPKFLNRRFQEFQSRDDPIYVKLLDGMEDEALAKTFVSYWMIGQTMATQSRFWLEDAIAEIIIHQAIYKNRPVTHVYSAAMLGQNLFAERKAIADLGESWREQSWDRSPWRATVQQSALREIDILVGEQEREPVPERNPFVPREFTSEKNTKAIAKDKDHLNRVVAALTGPPPSETKLQCNLLVIEPDRPGTEVHAWGIRFINPKSISSKATNGIRSNDELFTADSMRDSQQIPAENAMTLMSGKAVDYGQQLVMQSIGIEFDSVKRIAEFHVMPVIMSNLAQLLPMFLVCHEIQKPSIRLNGPSHQSTEVGANRIKKSLCRRLIKRL